MTCGDFQGQQDFEVWCDFEEIWHTLNDVQFFFTQQDLAQKWWNSTCNYWHSLFLSSVRYSTNQIVQTHAIRLGWSCGSTSANYEPLHSLNNIFVEDLELATLTTLVFHSNTTVIHKLEFIVWKMSDE